MKVAVSVSHNFPTAAAVQAEVEGVVRAHLGRLAEQVAEKYRAIWTGWQYKGRPPGAPREVSRDGWVAVSETTELAASVVNQTNDYRSGRSYVGAVHRAGSSDLAWKAHYETDIRPLADPLIQRMNAAVAEVLGG